MAEVNDNSSIQLFEDQKIRTAWDAEKEEWYFAIVDVISVLTDSANPQIYWRVLKKRLKDEGNETVTNCSQFTAFVFQSNFQNAPIFSSTSTILLLG